MFTNLPDFVGFCFVRLTKGSGQISNWISLGIILFFFFFLFILYFNFYFRSLI